MRHALGQATRVVSHTPGRIRIHLFNWRRERPEDIEAGLRKLPGVKAARTNPLTGNVLIHFDPQITTAEVLVAAADGLAPKPDATLPSPSGNGAAVLRAGLRGLAGHALVDTVFYVLAFTQPFGLPLAGLGVLHLGLDLIAWTVALTPLFGSVSERGRAVDSFGLHPAGHAQRSLLA
jgi:hypothetical protein